MAWLESAFLDLFENAVVFQPYQCVGTNKPHAKGAQDAKESGLFLSEI